MIPQSFFNICMKFEKLKFEKSPQDEIKKSFQEFSQVVPLYLDQIKKVSPFTLKLS